MVAACLRITLLAALVGLCFSDACQAQTQKQKRRAEKAAKKAQKNAEKSARGEGDNPGAELKKFNQVEGVVWQFTVENEETKETRKGKFRVDGQGLFKKSKRIGDVKIHDDYIELLFNEFDEINGKASIKPKSPGIYAGSFRDKDGKKWKIEVKRAQD